MNATRAILFVSPAIIGGLRDGPSFLSGPRDDRHPGIHTGSVREPCSYSGEPDNVPGSGSRCEHTRGHSSETGRLPRILGRTVHWSTAAQPNIRPHMVGAPNIHLPRH